LPRLSNCVMTPTMSRHRGSWPRRWTPSVRGDLYRLKAPADVRGHEQAGARYAVVVQSDDLPLSTWIVAPTSTGRRGASFRPEIEIDGTKTRVMVEQLTVIDPQARLGKFAGRQFRDASRRCCTADGPGPWLATAEISRLTRGPVRPTRFHESNDPRTDELEPEQYKRRLPHVAFNKSDRVVS
jgi:mRNA interferase MazF